MRPSEASVHSLAGVKCSGTLLLCLGKGEVGAGVEVKTLAEGHRALTETAGLGCGRAGGGVGEHSEFWLELLGGQGETGWNPRLSRTVECPGRRRVCRGGGSLSASRCLLRCFPDEPAAGQMPEHSSLTHICGATSKTAANVTLLR